MGREILVPPLDHDEAVAERCKPLASDPESLGVAVDPDDVRLPGGLEKSPRVSAEPQRRVDLDPAPLRPERRDDLPEEDGDVNRAGFGHGASDEMACEFVVVLIRDHGRAEVLEMFRAVDELQVIGLSEHEGVALDP